MNLATSSFPLNSIAVGRSDRKGNFTLKGLGPMTLSSHSSLVPTLNRDTLTSPVYSSKKLLRSRLAATQSEHQEYMPLLGDPSNTARIQSPDSLLASASMNFAYSSSSEGVLDIDMIRRCEKWYKGLTRFWRDPLLLHLGIMKRDPRSRTGLSSDLR